MPVCLSLYWIGSDGLVFTFAHVHMCTHECACVNLSVVFRAGDWESSLTTFSFIL